jgi:hypothetical protein
MRDQYHYDRRQRYSNKQMAQSELEFSNTSYLMLLENHSTPPQPAQNTSGPNTHNRTAYHDPKAAADKATACGR